MTPGKKLLSFAVLSAATHVLLLAALGALDGQQPAQVNGQQLQVSLLSGETQASASATSQAGGGSGPRKPAEIASEPVDMGRHDKAGQGINRSASTNENDSRVIAAANPASGDRVTIEIKRILAANFIYPPIALARGYQGRVIVRVDIESDGRISNARLHRSSGYNTLDLAAIASIRGIRQAPQLQQWLRGSRISINVPVVYRLIEA